MQGNSIVFSWSICAWYGSGFIRRRGESTSRTSARVSAARANGPADAARHTRSAWLCAGALISTASTARVVRGGLTEVDGARAMRQILAEPVPPTAVLAFNDECAHGVMDVLIGAGYAAPEDVSVVGYDDLRRASLASVPLTTVSQMHRHSRDTPCGQRSGWPAAVQR